MDCVVHGVTKCRTRLSDFHFHFTSFEEEENRSSDPVLLCDTDNPQLSHLQSGLHTPSESGRASSEGTFRGSPIA